MLLQSFHRGGNLLLRFLDLLGEGGPVQGDRRRVVSLGGAERLLGGDERLLERHALRLGLHELFFRTEGTLTKRPRLLGREKQTPKTCARGPGKEAEKKMEDRCAVGARIWFNRQEN